MKVFATERKRRGFTLIELLTAMAITAVLVLSIMQLTTQGISLWKNVNDDVTTTSTARIALQTMARDLESYQLKPGANDYQWFYACKDEDSNAPEMRANRTLVRKKSRRRDKEKPKALSYIPDSARFIFFACAPDRNPAVSSDPAAREGYRQDLASANDREGDPYLGDVNAIGYRLEYKDHIQNKAASQGDTGVYPVFALYRNVVSQRRTYEELLCNTDLYNSYRALTNDAEEDIICDNVVEMNLTVHIEYISSEATDKKAAEKRIASATVISSNGKAAKVIVTGDSVIVDGKVYANARIVSANISVTVLTEEGAALVERMRQGKARAPQPVDFFARYTRQFSTGVTLPQPY
ncbi:MAG: prepilin-type N-terminal cleavage/methylation domain-containing protein [Akkermansia sp.]|nr:prepilin-type N-terminal cleavage/methylation domain-containing protein [Akkermansia sp.]